MTLRLVADENFDNDVLHGVLRRLEDVDFVRVQDVGLRRADDPMVVQWAADEKRIVVTHDVSTIPDFAYQRLAAGLPMGGVFVLQADLPVGAAIDELVLVASASEADEWAFAGEFPVEMVSPPQARGRLGPRHDTQAGCHRRPSGIPPGAWEVALSGGRGIGVSGEEADYDALRCEPIANKREAVGPDGGGADRTA